MISSLVVGLPLAVALIGGFVIWRIERQRNRLLTSDGVDGVVVSKRDSAEHGEVQLFAQGMGLGRRIRVVPRSYVLTVATDEGERELVVDEGTFGLYDLGDSFP